MKEHVFGRTQQNKMVNLLTAINNNNLNENEVHNEQLTSIKMFSNVPSNFFFTVHA